MQENIKNCGKCDIINGIAPINRDSIIANIFASEIIYLYGRKKK